MGFVPPPFPEKPDWMSVDDYRQLIRREISLLRRASRGQCVAFELWAPVFAVLLFVVICAVSRMLS